MNVSMARRWCGVAGALAVVGYVVRPEFAWCADIGTFRGKAGLVSQDVARRAHSRPKDADRSRCRA
jgi:hypothetical protein